MMKIAVYVVCLLAVSFAEPPVGDGYASSRSGHHGDHGDFQSNSYLPPSGRDLSQQYGAPDFRNSPSEQYGAPSFRNSDSYSKSQGFGRSSPSQKYGAPSAFGRSGPSSTYGAPNARSGHDSYSQGRSLSQSYGAPSQRSLSQSYGAPQGSFGRSSHSHKSSSFRSGFPSQQYGAPSARGLSDTYGAPSARGLSDTYGAPGFGGRSAGSPSDSYGAPDQYSGQADQGYNYARNALDELLNQEPANYEFQYSVSDELSGSDFGHQESRQEDRAEGSYFVVLPDGTKQVVEYEADEHGFKPRISVEPLGYDSNASDRSGPY